MPIFKSMRTGRVMKTLLPVCKSCNHEHALVGGKRISRSGSRSISNAACNEPAPRRESRRQSCSVTTL